ncbi:MAG TPA: hypothetical protein VGC88_04475 [Terriglobales bacterium]
MRSISYQLLLRNAPAQNADVVMRFQSDADTEIRMPVWNALYQVRDFAENVSDVQVCNAGTCEIARQLSKSSWRVPAHGAVEVRYRIHLADPGPFGAELNAEHAFFNFAEVLPYVVGAEHRAPVSVQISDVPATWKLATPLRDGWTLTPPGRTGWILSAKTYDELVDSPTLIGHFDERHFSEGGKQYRVVVYGAAGSYDIARMTADAQKLVRAETAMMADAPFERYTFLYLVSPEGGGGMEHKYSTAIGLRPMGADYDWLNFDGVTAHEFFHLWNVKRIRPQTLEPVDYSREQYTRDLWFSEGMTSTMGAYALLKAGLTTPADFDKRLAATVQDFRSRPAHTWQSPEQSSLETWYDKYPYYADPERSVSYYTSGELIGYALDLAIREKTQGKKSVLDLFRYMNQHFAQAGTFFPEYTGELRSANAVCGCDLGDFFAKNVRTAGDLSLEDAMRSVGLLLEKVSVTSSDPGFRWRRNQGRVLLTTGVNSTAYDAGLREEDELLSIAGQAPNRRTLDNLKQQTAGSKVEVRVRRSGTELTLSVPLVAKREEQYRLTEAKDATPEQKARRKAWLAVGIE